MDSFGHNRWYEGVGIRVGAMRSRGRHRSRLNSHTTRQLVQSITSNKFARGAPYTPRRRPNGDQKTYIDISRTAGRPSVVVKRSSKKSRAHPHAYHLDLAIDRFQWLNMDDREGAGDRAGGAVVRLLEAGQGLGVVWGKVNENMIINVLPIGRYWVQLLS